MLLPHASVALRRNLFNQRRRVTGIAAGQRVSAFALFIATVAPFRHDAAAFRQTGQVNFAVVTDYAGDGAVVIQQADGGTKRHRFTHKQQLH